MIPVYSCNCALSTLASLYPAHLDPCTHAPMHPCTHVPTHSCTPAPVPSTVGAAAATTPHQPVPHQHDPEATAQHPCLLMQCIYRSPVGRRWHLAQSLVYHCAGACPEGTSIPCLSHVLVLVLRGCFWVRLCNQAEGPAVLGQRMAAQGASCSSLCIIQKNIGEYREYRRALNPCLG